MRRAVRDAPRDHRSRAFNRHTQPVREHPVFNNAGVVGEGWYPLLPAADQIGRAHV